MTLVTAVPLYSTEPVGELASTTTQGIFLLDQLSRIHPVRFVRPPAGADRNFLSN